MGRPLVWGVGGLSLTPSCQSVQLPFGFLWRSFFGGHLFGLDSGWFLAPLILQVDLRRTGHLIFDVKNGTPPHSLCYFIRPFNGKLLGRTGVPLIPAPSPESSHVDGEPVLAVELRNLQRRLHAILHGKESAAPQPRRGWASGGGSFLRASRCCSFTRQRCMAFLHVVCAIFFVALKFSFPFSSCVFHSRKPLPPFLARTKKVFLD